MSENKMQDGAENKVTAQFPWSFGSMAGQWILAYVIAFLGGAAIQILCMLGVGLLSHSAPLSAEAKSLAMSVILTLSYVGGFGGAALYLSGKFRKQGLSMGKEMSINLDSLGGSWGRAFKLAFFGLLAVFALNILLQLLPLPAPDSPAGDMAVQFSGLSFMVFALSGVVAAPILEEVLFRGYLMNACRIGFRQGFFARLFGGNARIADYAAIAVSSAIFAGAHFTLTGFPQLFAAGLVMAALYRRTGSLVPSMLLHFLMNSLAFVALYMQTLAH